MSHSSSTSHNRSHSRDRDRDSLAHASRHAPASQRSRRRSASPSNKRRQNTTSHNDSDYPQSNYEYDGGYDRDRGRGRDRIRDRDRDRARDHGYEDEYDQRYDRSDDRGFDRHDDRRYGRNNDRGYDRGYERNHSSDRDHRRPYENHNDRRNDNRYDDHRSKKPAQDPPPLRRYPDKETSEPNISIVLRGLPEHAQEQDIEEKLKSMGAIVDNVSLIRCRDTGESRKFAFVRFASVGHATEFYNKIFCFFMDSHRVRVDYCDKDDHRDERQEIRCTNCGKFNSHIRRDCVECRKSLENARPANWSTFAEPLEINDGEKDVSHTISAMVLLRGLNNLWTEEQIYDALKHMEGLKRVILVRNRATDVSSEFAFAEFKNIQCAAHAVDMKDECKIHGQSVIVTFANPEISFLPVYANSKWAIRTDVPDNLWIYRDDQAYACEYSAEIIAERARKLELEREEETRKKEERRKQEEEKAKAKAKEDTLDQDLNAFYADMNGFLSDAEEDTSDVFSLPKPQAK